MDDSADDALATAQGNELVVLEALVTKFNIRYANRQPNEAWEIAREIEKIDAYTGLWMRGDAIRLGALRQTAQEYRSKDIGAALALYGQALRIKPLSAPLFAKIAKAHLVIRNYADAAQAIQLAKDVNVYDPEVQDAATQLARITSEQRKDAAVQVGLGLLGLGLSLAGGAAVASAKTLLVLAEECLQEEERR